MLKVLCETYDEYAVYQKCDSKVCGIGGRCFMNYDLEPTCHCYQQYYKGKYCRKVRNSCLEPTELTPACDNEGKKQCSDSWGMSVCECIPSFYGRFCQFASPDNEPMDKWQYYPGVFAALQPVQQWEYQVYTVVHTSDTATDKYLKKIRTVIEGFAFDDNPKEIADNFVETDNFYRVIKEQMGFMKYGSEKVKFWSSLSNLNS